MTYCNSAGPGGRGSSQDFCLAEVRCKEPGHEIADEIPAGEHPVRWVRPAGAFGRSMVVYLCSAVVLTIIAGAVLTPLIGITP